MRSIAEGLGAEPSGQRIEIALLVPSTDRDGQPIDHEFWRLEALRFFGTLFGGATATTGIGVWRDDERSGELIVETVATVLCRAEAAALTEEALRRLRELIHRMGRETRQAAVLLRVNDDDIFVTTFD